VETVGRTRPISVLASPDAVALYASAEIHRLCTLTRIRLRVDHCGHSDSGAENFVRISSKPFITRRADSAEFWLSACGLRSRPVTICDVAYCIVHVVVCAAYLLQFRFVVLFVEKLTKLSNIIKSRSPDRRWRSTIFEFLPRDAMLASAVPAMAL